MIRDRSHVRWSWKLRHLIGGATGLVALLLVLAAPASASVSLTPGAALAPVGVSCPNANPVVNENNCMGPGTSANRIANYSDKLGGFSTQTSSVVGQSVSLKIGSGAASSPNTKVNIAVYRLGYYGGAGARLMTSANNVAVNNTLGCNAPDPNTGLYSCANWGVTYTVPASALPISGLYEAVFTDTGDGGIQNYVVFPVRDDARASNMLFVLSDATYEAYNTWGCKSLYFDICGGANTVAGDGRAVAVSFDRPLAGGDEQRNTPLGPDLNLITWLEEQGYDVTYTDDIQLDANPAALTNHKTIVISGHSEYWSAAAFNNVLAARNAGVNVASFSSNTAYWQTRYANSYRTLICYKTIQGNSSGGSTPNDPASVGTGGQTFPQFATTTRRDQGDPTAGRVGPNQPENQLWGNMYVGDNESTQWGMTVPPATEGGAFAGSRVWRNAGLSSTASTTIDSDLIGWEWDQIPSASSPAYANAAAVEPPGVKQISQTNTAAPDDSWLQDEGRVRATTPAPGMTSSVSAVEYRWQPSGALVFAAGTNQWAYGLDTDAPINQATYNIFSDMNVQPLTPEPSLVLDNPSSPQPPWASFTATPAAALTSQTIAFDASATKDPSGTVTDYKWDFSGAGTFTDTGTAATTSYAYSTPGTYTVVLKVTDSNGLSDVTTRTVTVANPLSATISASPNPASLNQKVTFDASGSKDLIANISDYRWDLSGSGSYTTDTGTTPTTTTTFATTGAHTVGVQVSDKAGNVATATITAKVVSTGVSNYTAGVLATPGLLHFYPMNEAVGPVINDRAGSANGTTSQGTTFGQPGAVNGDPNSAVSFDGPSGNSDDPGVPGYGKAPIDLSSQKAVTIEFWMNWTAYANDDALAMEFTSNYNQNPGGFLVDPNAPDQGGSFAVGIGQGSSRTAVFFARPSAGVWHHYALVLDSTQTGASQIKPYVDGQPVSILASTTGSGMGTFANSTLSIMSRNAGALFGTGSLQDLAIYSGDLTASRILEHFQNNGADPRPVASFAASPPTPRAGQSVTFDASGSSYSQGTIVKYEWDLTGSGSYSGPTTNPKVTTSYATAQTADVGLRVTDSNGGWDYITRPISVGTFPPAASISASPQPALTGSKVTLDASGSTDQGTITDYRWDLDGSGAYATDTGTKPSVATTFATGGLHTVGVQVTDDQGLSSKKTLGVGVLMQGVISYPKAVLQTPGLTHFWRMNESAGPAIADSVGSANGTISGGAFGQSAPVQGDPSTSIGFNGSTDFGTVPLDLSATKQLTVEFWLKWNGYANNDALAMEFTPNYNQNSGGFLVDPNCSQFGGTFCVGFGEAVAGTQNYVYFQRPSAGVWHHYVFVLDPSQPPSSEVTPYVDGVPASFQVGNGSSGAGAFAKATLYLMSRAGTSLIGAGQLADLALYNADLDAGTVYQHYNSYGTNQPPVASFSASVNPARPGQSVTFDASKSTDIDASIVDYQWDPTGSGTYSVDTGSNPHYTTSFATAQTATIGLRVIDALGASATTSATETVGNYPPGVSLNVTPNPGMTGQAVKLDGSGSVALQGTITDYRWDLDGSGTYATDTGTTPTLSHVFTTAGTYTVGLKVTDSYGQTATTTTSLVINQALSPALTISPNPAATGQSVRLDATGSTDGAGTITDYRWDFTGSGSYSVDTGATASVTHTWTVPGSYSVGVQVTDSNGQVATKTQKLSVTSSLTPAFTMTPSPASVGNAVALDGSKSTDTQGSITDFRWDLDGSGTYATDTGSSPRLNHTWATAGQVTVGLQVTDSNGVVATSTQTLDVHAQTYVAAVQSTAGLLDYYRLNESVGPTIADSKGTASGTVTGATFGAPGAVAGIPDTAISFNGTSDFGAISLDLSATKQLTVEFWMKWNTFANDDALAMEYTPNYNQNPGGFIVDPNCSAFGGVFCVGMGQSGAGTQNYVYFARPTAGVWHHYALVFDATQPASGEVTVYLDGQLVSTQPGNASGGAGAFAKATLYLMSRAGSGLFAGGSLAQLSLYGTDLSAATIAAHYTDGTP